MGATIAAALTYISIHAPLRGATGGRRIIQHDGDDFYPRTPTGCDLWSVGKSRVELLFLSTHPCGVRRRPCSALAGHYLDFYPRTPAGCDYSAVTKLLNGQVFLSTHPCGVRPDPAVRWPGTTWISIHAPLRGATRPCSTLARHDLDFYPRTPAGCDVIKTEQGGANCDFYPRTPAGCDRA